MADQKQAGDTDLSQSAYDSAQAGVEDAKRALLRYQQICTNTPASCATEGYALSSSNCNDAVTRGGVAVKDVTTGEVKVQQSTTVDQVLDQAYTCLTMQLQTDDYVGNLAAGQSEIVPLVVPEGATFNTVTVRWFSKDDVSTSSYTVTPRSIAATQRLIEQDNWGRDTPSVMRTQLIQFGANFTMAGFDVVSSGGAGTQSNANTVFLYPVLGAGGTSAAFTGLDTRKTNAADEPPKDNPSNTPYAVSCSASVASQDYACAMSLRLPDPIGGGAQRTAFLRLTPLYNAAHYQVQLSNGDPTTAASIVRFKDVQPIIDSTGRANNMFRRVQARVNLYNTNFPYPDATIDIASNFCKVFSVSDDAATYRDSNTCTP
jgi:hypothetical protein